jgi:hypothetical protein
VLSRWPVLLFLPVGADEVGGDGRLTEAACERLFAAGRAEYFALCSTIDAADVEVVTTSAAQRGVAVGGDEVSVSVSVTELFPDRFEMAARIRPSAGEGVAADLRCTVSAGEVTPAIRDDLIAVAHAAAHWH